MLPSLLRLLCRMGALTLPVPAPIPSPCVWLNTDRGESAVASDRWRSMEAVGLRRRVGLLPEGGELMLGCGGRLIRLLRSSPPVKEPDEEELKRKEKRSKRLPTGSAPAPNSCSFAPKRSVESPESGRELARKRGRWACLFSNVWLPKMTLWSRRELCPGDWGTPFPLSIWDCKSSKEQSDFLGAVLLIAGALKGEFTPLIPDCSGPCGGSRSIGMSDRKGLFSQMTRTKQIKGINKQNTAQDFNMWGWQL